MSNHRIISKRHYDSSKWPITFLCMYRKDKKRIILKAIWFSCKKPTKYVHNRTKAGVWAATIFLLKDIRQFQKVYNLLTPAWNRVKTFYCKLCTGFPVTSEQKKGCERYRRITQTDRNWDKDYFSFSDVWNVKICTNYTILNNVKTKIQCYVYGYLFWSPMSSEKCF